MIQFLPENLDMANLLTEHPPAFPYHQDYFIHILSLITEIPSRKSKVLNGNGYVPINAEILKQRIHNYPRYMDYLIKQGVLESDVCYVPGKKSKGYRFVEKYRTIVVPANIKKYTLLKSINTQSNYSRHMTAKYGYLYKWVDERIEIDYERAKEWLYQRFRRDIEENKKNPLMKYNARFANLLQIKEGMHRFRIDRTSGRLHTLLCSLKKELRQFVTYDGQSLVSVDIRCSQPTLSTVLLNPDFYIDMPDHKGILNIHRIAASIAKAVPVESISKFVTENREKFASYINAVDGDLYLYIQERLKEAGHEIADRKAIKDVVFCTLFSSNRFIGQKKAWPKRMFQKLFPEVYHVFKMFKSGDPANLAVLLQRIETRLVLDNAAKKLAKQYPDLPILTVHDSIVVPPSHQQLCKDILSREAQRLLGIKIHLNDEPWQPEKVLVIQNV